MKYRLPELEVPTDNPFQYDALERKPVLEFLSSLIGKLEGPFVLALDSPWGTGKTTIVKMLQAKLAAEQFQCVYFNAWKVDYVTDPLVALVSALDEIKLTQSKAKSAFHRHLKTVKEITSAVAKRVVVTGVKAATMGVLDVKEDFEKSAAEVAGDMASNLVDAFQKEKQALEKFRLEVEKAVEQLKAEGKKETLIFFVDELDRCRPTFAIEMLERIKHLFDVPNIVFVLSIDKSQLEASTAAVYGEKINAPEYLRRFIDLEYGVPVVQTKKFTEFLLVRSELHDAFKLRNSYELQSEETNFVNFFTALSDVFQVSLRARERCITRMVVVMSQTLSNQYLDPILVALLLVLRSNKPRLFQNLCNGLTTPAEVMAEIASLPGGSKMVADRPGLLIESYLLMSDPDRKRQDIQYRKLVEISQFPNLPNLPPSRESELVQMMQRISGQGRDWFNLREIAVKIDLAVNVKE
jgi:KAP family P-loop domain